MKKIYWLFILSVFLFFVLSTFVRFFWDSSIMNMQFVLASYGYEQSDFSSHIVMVVIDEYSEKKMNQTLESIEWRKTDPVVIRKLTQVGALVLGFDIEFTGKSTIYDKELSQAYSEAPYIITCEKDKGSTVPELRKNIHALTDPSTVTYSGRPRRILEYPSPNGLRAFSYEMVLAKLRSGNQKSPNDSETAGKHHLPEGGYWINFCYPYSYFPMISYADVYYSENNRLDNSHKTPMAVFKNKIIIIAKEFDKDSIALPNSLGREIFGGVVHAYGVQTLLDGSHLKRDHLVRFINILISGFFFFMYQYLIQKKKLSLLLVLFFAIVLHFIISYSLFVVFNFWNYQWGFYMGIILLSAMNLGYRRYLQQQEWSIVNKKLLQLEHFNRILEESGEMRDILTDTLVHDIKNAIASIEGSLNFMTQKYQEDPLSRKIVQAASIACTDILNLSSNLLDIRKMEEGQFELQSEECVFNQFKDMIERYTHYPQFFEKKMDLSIEIPENDFVVKADPYLMEQIFHNLLNNALKYTPAKGKITISFIKEKIENRICIFNSGKPLPEDQLEKIFEKYAKLGKRSKYSKGMGLFFCRKAMDMQKARIWAQSDSQGNYFFMAFKNNE